MEPPGRSARRLIAQPSLGSSQRQLSRRSSAPATASSSFDPLEHLRLEASASKVRETKAQQRVSTWRRGTPLSLLASHGNLLFSQIILVRGCHSRNQSSRGSRRQVPVQIDNSLLQSRMFADGLAFYTFSSARCSANVSSSTSS